MAAPRAARDQHAHGGVWPRRRPGRRSDYDPGSLPVAKLVLYGARGCHLCERAKETIERVRAELEFELAEVDITGDTELESRYRELIPVVEIDGRRAFTYFVDPAALRRQLAES